MRSIAVINQKGGVGKTTTSVNLAAALARAGSNVLLVDLDPQAHASLHLGIELAPGERSVYDVFAHGAAVAEAARSAGERLTVLPAHVDLVATDMELAGVDGRERILRERLEAYREHFDLVIFDCAPSLGVLTVNALACADEVLIPLQPHFLALHGLGKLLETIAFARERLNPRLRVCGVLLCMFEPATRLAQEVAGDVARFLAAAAADAPWHGAVLFETRIRRNIKLAESPSFGRSIFDYAPGSHGAEDYAGLAREVSPGERVVSAGSAARGEVEAVARRAVPSS